MQKGLARSFNGVVLDQHCGATCASTRWPEQARTIAKKDCAEMVPGTGIEPVRHF
jgi:hypothetical protein